ncbi:MAG: hypothetical protein ACYCXO_14525, partial [Candidatus Humimicrobiaceae bacterium]
VFNRAFLDFCDHYGVMPQAAPPYWAQVKGKVERGVGYVKGSFCVFRPIPATEFGLNRPPISEQTGHLFRSKPATFSRCFRNRRPECRN